MSEAILAELVQGNTGVNAILPITFEKNDFFCMSEKEKKAAFYIFSTKANLMCLRPGLVLLIYLASHAVKE